MKRSVKTHSDIPVFSPIPDFDDGGQAGYCTFWRYCRIPAPKEHARHFLEEGEITDQSEFETEEEAVYNGDLDDSLPRSCDPDCADPKCPHCYTDNAEDFTANDGVSDEDSD